MQTRPVNPKYCTQRIRVDYPHVGIFDTKTGMPWLVKRRMGQNAMRVSHARMLIGGTQDTSTTAKDQYLCYWFHTPGSGHGKLFGQNLNWDEGQLILRIDPHWNYQTMELIASTDTARMQRNIRQQHRWGEKLFQAYAAAKPKFAMSWNLVGPRAEDSMFDIERYEPR